MGGYGSGRSGGRPTTGDARSLDIGKLFRDGTFRLGSHSSGSIVWTDSYSGERTASIGFEASIGDASGWFRLVYAVTSWAGEKRHVDSRVRLETTPQPFGGRTWWWVCPRSGLRVKKLYLPAGATEFASRQAYRLGYRCQRQTPHDRAINRAFKLRRKLGSDGAIGDHIDKPKRMRWTTFDREVQKLVAAETICNAHLIVVVDRLRRGLIGR